MCGRLCVAVGVALLTGGCFPLPPIPITIPLNIDISFGDFKAPLEFTLKAGTGHIFGDFVDQYGNPLDPGELLDNYPTERQYLDTFPKEAEIMDLVEDEAEEEELELEEDVLITEINLELVHMDADKYGCNFNTITTMDVYFEPKQGASPILVGSASATDGFGVKIDLVSPEATNFYKLIKDNDSNPIPGYPRAYTEISGDVPEDLPKWDPSVVVSVNGEVSLKTEEVELEDFPEEEFITQTISDVAGKLIASLVHVNRLELVSVNMTATEGDFNALTEVHLFYVPKSGSELGQDEIEIGQAVSESGLGEILELAPPEDGPVDFLELIRDNDANEAEGWPTAYMTVKGDIPESLPKWDTEVSLKVYASVGLF